MSQDTDDAVRQALQERITQLEATKTLFCDGPIVKVDKHLVWPFYVRWLDVEPIMNDLLETIRKCSCGHSSNQPARSVSRE